MADTPLTFVHIVVLALLQGITEFLPISSSAHLILVPVVTGWPDQGTEIDVAVHVGTLGAVLIYFRRDVTGILAGIANGLRGRRSSATDRDGTIGPAAYLGWRYWPNRRSSPRR